MYYTFMSNRGIFLYFTLIMAVRIKCICLNIRGFGNDPKQSAIFDFARQSRADIIFLQETLVAAPDAIKRLRGKRPDKSFWSPV